MIFENIFTYIYYIVRNTYVYDFLQDIFLHTDLFSLELLFTLRKHLNTFNNYKCISYFMIK